MGGIRVMKLIKNNNDTLRDLLVGICIFTVAIALIGAMLLESRFSFVLGVFLGGVIAFFLAIHLNNTIGVALDSEPEQAKRYTTRMAFIRLLVMIGAVAVALIFPNVFHTVGVLLGVLTLKISAYCRPFINKYITNKIGKGR